MCSLVNEQFLSLVVREEERRRQEEQATAHTQAPVKTKMLRRISRAAVEQGAVTTTNERGMKKKEKKSGKSKKQQRRSTDEGKKMRREKTRSNVEESADRDFVLVPLDSSGPSEASGGIESPSGGGGGGGGGLAEEIGKQFLAVTTTPAGTGGKKRSRGPKLKRLKNTAEGGSQSKRTRNLLAVNQGRGAPSMESLEGSRADLLPPLVVSRASARHDGNVVTQELENTEGVRVPDILDLLSTRSKTRLTVGPDSFPNSASGSEPTLEPMQLSQFLLVGTAPPFVISSPASPPPFSPPPPPLTPSPPLSPSPPPHSPPATGREEEGESEVDQELSESRESAKRKSRTSELLDTMEEGEVETR